MLAQALFLKSYALNAGRNTGMEIRKFLEKTRGIITPVSRNFSYLIVKKEAV
jgi:hypothetical protein